MTTDTAPQPARPLGSLIIGVSLLCAWLSLALLAMLPGRIETALIPATTTSLPAGVAVIDRRGPFLIVQSDAPGYVRALYAAGAGFVLPAPKGTCLDLQNV